MRPVRTSLEVGFPGEALPARFAPLRGRVWRATDRATALVGSPPIVVRRLS